MYIYTVYCAGVVGCAGRGTDRELMHRQTCQVFDGTRKFRKRVKSSAFLRDLIKLECAARARCFFFFFVFFPATLYWLLWFYARWHCELRDESRSPGTKRFYTGEISRCYFGMRSLKYAGANENFNPTFGSWPRFTLDLHKCKVCTRKPIQNPEHLYAMNITAD